MCDRGCLESKIPIVMAESGTCNVCSAPCTSCMHFNRLVTGVKTEASSGEAFCDNTSSQYSANKSAIVNPLKKHSFDNIRDTASATSSHESISENDENNETVRTSVSADATYSDFSGVRSLGRGQIPRSLTCYSNVEKPNKFDQKSGEECMEGPVVSGSDVAVKPEMKAELKTERDNNYIPEESLDVVSASKGKSNDLAEQPDETEPSMESHSGDESEEIVEHDVNICDICGDAGMEHLLATCSGCSDGAEHTYCMQEKMEKVPEGEWFCEECRLAQKIQKQRDTGDEAVKVQPYSRLRSLNRNLSLKLDSNELCVDRNSTEIYTPGTQSRKRQLEKFESSTGLKRQATEITQDLSAASSPHRLSRDGSFKSGVREKVNKSLYQPYHGMNNVSAQLQTHKGLLSKSNSFNAVTLKPKGKSVDDMPYRGKMHCEPSDARDGANRLMARSMSLRPVHLGRPNAGEPKVIMLSPKSSHAPEIKGFKKSKEYLSYDRKKVIRDERAPSMSSSRASALDTNQKTGSCENGFMSSDHNSRDSKATQSDEKVVPLSKLTGHATRSASDMSEKKPSKPLGKDESTMGIWTAAKHISNVDAIMNPELLQSEDASYQILKNTGNNLTRSRLGKSVSGSNLCHRCKEPITASHVCIISSPRISASGPSTVKIPVDDIEKMNPVKAALHAAFLKKSIIGSSKGRAPDHEQFDEQPITPKSNGQNAPLDVWSGSNYTKNTSSAEKKHIQKLPLHNFSYAAGQESRIDNLDHSSLLSKEVMIPANVGGDGKSITKVLPNHSLPHMCTAPTSAIPVHEYIWQGDFEVNRNGEKVADMHPGFQAHLSTFASPKVMEVVHKLSPRLSLTEIPRLSAWPAQFHETGATEDNIALYFFAKDIESYERYYKILLDNMMRNDLALKGVVSGVEILIFPSSQLPQKSQRWNMLFFMWGVFHAKKHNCQSVIAGSSRNFDASGKSCIVASDASPSTPVPACTVPLTESKQLDCEFVRCSMSGRSSSCMQPLSKRCPANYEEEHIVDMGCEVKPNPRLNGGTAVTDRPAMHSIKCTSALKNSVTDDQGQELHYVGPEEVNCFGNEEKEVDRVTVERKIKNAENEPSMRDVSAKDFEFGQSNNKNRCHGDLAEICCLDSDIDIGKSQLESPGSKDVKVRCPTSDTHETGPSISSKKIMYDLNLDAGDIMDESGTAEGFLSAVKSPQVIDYQDANFSGWDLNSSANDDQVDGDSKDRQDSGFDLSLCAADTESFPPRNGALPLFVKMGKPFEGGAGRKEDAPAASLSLSLALPFMDDNHQSSKQATTTSAEQLHYGPTQAKPPFPLFGGLADK